MGKHNITDSEDITRKLISSKDWTIWFNGGIFYTRLVHVRYKISESEVFYVKTYKRSFTAEAGIDN